MHGANDFHQPPPRYAYRRGSGVSVKLVALSLTMSKIRILRLSSPDTAPTTAAFTVSAASDVDASAAAAARSSAYDEIMGVARSGPASELPRAVSGISAVVAEAARWDDMGCIGLVELLRAPVLPSSGDERKQPMFVMAEDAQIVLTESSRCGSGVDACCVVRTFCLMFVLHLMNCQANLNARIKADSEQCRHHILAWQRSHRCARFAGRRWSRWHCTCERRSTSTGAQTPTATSMMRQPPAPARCLQARHRANVILGAWTMDHCSRPPCRVASPVASTTCRRARGLHST